MTENVGKYSSRRGNPAVDAAFEAGTYTAKDGATYSRGMDGWFLKMGDGGVMVVRHHDMADLIEAESAGAFLEDVKPDPAWTFAPDRRDPTGVRGFPAGSPGSAFGL